VKLEALDHPKTLDLAARLNVELPTAIGYLELLWAFTGKKAPQGNIGKWPDGAIARACYWMGRPEQFTQALQESGFLDADSTHRLTVHDWHEHAPRWVKSKLSSLNVGFVSGTCTRAGSTSCPVPPDIPKDVSQPVSPDTGQDSKGREGKTREEPNPHALAREVSGLDLGAWERWLAYRQAKRKPIRAESAIAAAREMAALGDAQQAAVEKSIAAGWQGLFPPKGKPVKAASHGMCWPDGTPVVFDR